MQIKPNIRGTIRSLEVGETFEVPYSVMLPDGVRNAASLAGLRENGKYTVNTNKEKRITKVTRIS